MDNAATLNIANFQEGKDVFISYSRKDKDFVRWLDAQFAAHGRKAWIDWSSIQPGEKWWPSILHGIDSTNTFIFVLSPDSVQSKVARQEIERAVESGKRIVPVVLSSVSTCNEHVHPALAERNYIFLDTEEKAAQGIADLFKAIDQDLDHVNAHTKFLIRAREWNANKRHLKYLLRGGLLEEADLWLTQIAGKLPLPTQLHSEYILASRNHARKQRRTVLASISGGLAVAIGLAVLSFVGFRNADHQRIRAEEKTEEANLQRTRAEEKTEEANHLRIQAEEKTVEANNQRIEAEKERKRAEQKTEEATNNLIEALRREGRIYLERAKQASIPAQQVLAAKALSFSGYGRPDDPKKNPFYPPGDPFWTTDPFWKTEPVRLQPGLDQREIGQAEDLLGKGRLESAPPVLSWFTPVAWRSDGSVTSVAFSPDGSRIACGSKGYVGDSTVKIWEAASGTLLSTLEDHSSQVTGVGFSPDGSRIIFGSGDYDSKGTVKIWEVASGKLLALEGHSNDVASVAFSPDGSRVVSGSGDKTVKIWEAASGKLLATLEGHLSGVNSVAYSPDGSRVASGSGDGTVKIWDVALGQVLATLEGHLSSVNSVAYSPDGSRIVSGSFDQTVKIWDVALGQVLVTLEGHVAEVNSVAFSPDGLRIVSGSGNSRDLRANHGKAVKIWAAASGKLLATLEGHSEGVTSVTFSPDGSRIVSGSNDNTVKIWESASGPLLATLDGHSDSVTSVAFSPDGSRIVSGCGARLSEQDNNTVKDNTAKIWDAASGKLLAVLAEHLDDVNSVGFSPDGSRIVSGSWDKTVKIWEAASGKLLTTLEGHSHWVESVAFSPDGSRIVSGSWDKTLKIWEAASGKLLTTLEGHLDDVNSVAFSPDGSRIVSASDDQTVRIWDTALGQLLTTLEGHLSGVNSVAFSPDGSRIASASDDQTVKIWETASGKLLATLEGHSGSVYSVAFSPDDSRIVSGSGDLKIWEAASGKLLATFEGHSGGVLSVAFSLDGSRIVSGARDKTVKIWDAPKADCDPSRWFDATVYLRNGWAEIDPTNQSLQWLPADQLFHGQAHEMVNVPPNSLTEELRETKLESERHLIRARHYLHRMLWAPFWASWEQLSAAQQKEWAGQVIPTFALLAADPPKTVVLPGLCESRFLQLRAAYPEVAVFPDQLTLGGFVSGVLKSRTNHRLGPFALEALEGQLDGTPTRLMNHAVLLFRLGDSGKATALLEEQLEKEDQALTAQHFSDAYHRAATQERRDEFDWLLGLATQRFPSDPVITYMEGRSLMNFKDYAKAVEQFQRSLKLKEEAGEYIGAFDLVGLAGALWASGRTREAVDCYRRFFGLPLPDVYFAKEEIENGDWPDSETKPILEVLEETLRRMEAEKPKKGGAGQE